MPGDLGHGARGDGTLPVAPSLAPTLEGSGERADVRAPREYEPVDGRSIVVAALAIVVAALAIVIALGAGLVAQLLVSLIGLVTNLAFYGRLATEPVAPGGAGRGALVILLVPVLGAIVVGLMARYGSAAIRGHGIPEVMEKVHYGESRIPARVMFLKPLSAAVAIGTGGPFGAEGPIIATGGALGSMAGQLLRVTVDERKTLLAAGAAAGMAATFGSPVSAVLLAVELLLFEYRPRSLVPVALAAGGGLRRQHAARRGRPHGDREGRSAPGGQPRPSARGGGDDHAERSPGGALVAARGEPPPGEAALDAHRRRGRRATIGTTPPDAHDAEPNAKPYTE